MTTSLPILYSFRRCPYAIRARLAIQASGIEVELREVVLRDKPPDFLASSPKGTVPIIVNANEVVEESLDIMLWALSMSDPKGWLKMPDAGYEWIARNDGPFKTALDHTKYSVRYPQLNPHFEREKAKKFLHDLDTQIGSNMWIFGKNCTLADMAILPFVRQFSNINNNWFSSQNWQNIHRWLTAFLHSNKYNSVMIKYDKWIAGDSIISFPIKQKLFSTQGLTI